MASQGYMIHAHPFYELYYFVRGEVDYLLSGVERQLRPGTMLVILPNEFHGVRVHSAAVYERWTLHFDPDMLGVERRDLLLEAAEGDPALRFLEDAGAWGLEETFAGFDSLAGVEEGLQRKLIPLFTEALLGRLLVYRRNLPLPARPNTRPSDVVKQVAAYLNEHFTERITLDGLAEKYFISKSHLNMIFRRAMGATVMEYLSHKRVTYAQQLLINGLSCRPDGGSGGVRGLYQLLPALCQALWTVAQPGLQPPDPGAEPAAAGNDGYAPRGRQDIPRDGDGKPVGAPAGNQARRGKRLVTSQRERSGNAHENWRTDVYGPGQLPDPGGVCGIPPAHRGHWLPDCAGFWYLPLLKAHG